MRYAQNTGVAVERSKAEIENLLLRYGADQFQSGWKDQGSEKPSMAVIQFFAKKKHIRFVLPLPSKNDPAFFKTPSGRERERSPVELQKIWEQSCRQAWRAMALVVKAKLEAVESGITSFEEEFYAHIVLPNGKTIFQETIKSVELAYQSGKVANLLEFK